MVLLECRLDYLVTNKPGWKARGEDDQLKKAVEVLLQGLK